MIRDKKDSKLRLLKIQNHLKQQLVSSFGNIYFKQLQDEQADEYRPTLFQQWGICERLFRLFVPLTVTLLPCLAALIVEGWFSSTQHHRVLNFRFTFLCCGFLVK